MHRKEKEPKSHNPDNTYEHLGTRNVMSGRDLHLLRLLPSLTSSAFLPGELLCILPEERHFLRYTLICSSVF